CEEAETPSWPFEFTTTVEPATFAPKIPAINVLVCVPWLPMRIVFGSPAVPGLPMSILLLPVVRLGRHEIPPQYLRCRWCFRYAQEHHRLCCYCRWCC